MWSVLWSTHLPRSMQGWRWRGGIPSFCLSAPPPSLVKAEYLWLYHVSLESVRALTINPPPPFKGDTGSPEEAGQSPQLIGSVLVL